MTKSQSMALNHCLRSLYAVVTSSETGIPIICIAMHQLGAVCYCTELYQLVWGFCMECSQLVRTRNHYEECRQLCKLRYLQVYGLMQRAPVASFLGWLYKIISKLIFKNY